MPHLSPMNWLLAISSFWLIISIIMSENWWSQPNTFKCPKLTSKASSSISWKWL
uniref:ATP synthase subunit 8 n=1 Tax=Mesenchytraeus cf. pedatus SL-2017 TaxID=2052678 RepID=A0A286JZ83_9ANNE|nr:ATP synthase subunit 8 [Mesenchytraeus cf. pedatus SL-2017]